MNDEALPVPMEDWRTTLDERIAKQVEFAATYCREFNHGAPGHLDFVTITTLAALLDRYALTEGRS